MWYTCAFTKMYRMTYCYTSQNPFRLAEIAIELQIERLRVVEITRARDTALQRLEECCAIIRQKNEYIKQFQDDCDGGHTSIDVVHQADRFSGDVTEVEQLKAHICSLETRNEELRVSVAKLRAFSKVDLPPCYESEERKVSEPIQQTFNVCINLNKIGYLCRGSGPDRYWDG